MASKYNEDTVEQAALIWLQELGYTHIYGPDIAPDQPAAERENYREVILTGRLRHALEALNPHFPPEAIDEALRQLTVPQTPSLTENNHRFHNLLVNGVNVGYQDSDGRTVYQQARVLNYGQPEANDWLAVNQFSIRRDSHLHHQAADLEGTYRPDILIFVNGLPLAVIELKNTGDEQATTEKAFHQLQTYKQGIPNLFIPNCALVASDGADARLGSLTSGWEWFKPWRAVSADPHSDTLALDTGESQLETLLRGVFTPAHFLDLTRYFTVFETYSGQIVKKTAGYHQFYAVNKAVHATVEAIHKRQDGKVGVVWHTQGSGKSLSMLFYAGKIIQQPAMANPTLVVLTDRNDLDDQLFHTFSIGHELLRQTPKQAESIEDLREKLKVAAGSVIFTTIQKFAPPGDATLNEPLSERSNIVFIVDEAHRSQYGFESRFIEDAQGVRQVYGLAQHMRDALPNATFIGFTGTPISLTDRNTRHVFGDYIDIYDIQRAVEDQATVPIYYEARHAKLNLDAAMQPQIDPEFEEVTEGQEEILVEKTKNKWARLAAVVGAEERLDLVAADIVSHYEMRNQALPGKAMIVGMTRDICARLYKKIIDLRPEWHGDKDDEGRLKVVISGSSSDTQLLQPHIRTKSGRRELATRFRKADSGFDLVIVRDMWLTGFDAPALHTMYVDKPMKGHGLMQAIARVNRVYPEKEGGLVVAYLPLELQLQEALKDYTEGDKKQINVQDAAAEEMVRYYHIVKDMFFGFDYRPFIEDDHPTKRLTLLSQAAGHILKGRDQKRNRFIEQTTALGRAYALANPHPDAVAIRDEVAFFQIVKASLVKTEITNPVPMGNGRTPQAVDAAVQSIVDRAVAPEAVVDLLSLAGIKKPDIGILSE
ncbi:MAG: type I restriction endonuclease subunit R, partial [Anaerolineales bacterium]|nr:type I restriction endonuclease subunit R [Anaerolineales bacterium]